MIFLVLVSVSLLEFKKKRAALKIHDIGVNCGEREEGQEEIWWECDDQGCLGVSTAGRGKLFGGLMLSL